MKDVNHVIDGDYQGKAIVASLGKVLISLSTFKSLGIDKETVEKLEIVGVQEYKDSQSYNISILFKSGEKCLILVDNHTYETILKIWPEVKTDSLKNLLKEGYTIVGFSSFNFVSSGLGAGATSHDILLQKNLNVKKISFITMGDKQFDGRSHVFSAE